MIVKVIIDRFENDKAVLKTHDNETIIWPKNKLPGDTKEGSTLILAITNNKEDKEVSQQLAKDILNEILGAQ